MKQRFCLRHDYTIGTLDVRKACDPYTDMGSVTTAGFFPLDLGFLGLVWVSGYFSGKSGFFHKGA